MEDRNLCLAFVYIIQEIENGAKFQNAFWANMMLKYWKLMGMMTTARHPFSQPGTTHLTLLSMISKVIMTSPPNEAIVNDYISEARAVYERDMGFFFHFQHC